MSRSIVFDHDPKDQSLVVRTATLMSNLWDAQVCIPLSNRLTLQFLTY